MSSANNELDKAIATASSWAETGWSMTFGPRNVQVNSLKEAHELRNGFPQRLEAISYWEDIKTLGQETAQHGKKAKAALEKGDLNGAINALYLARYMEKRVDENSPTWGPAYLAVVDNS
ncbi:MAG: hypothetical protein HQL69_15960 [Magnetococcales bacterium]|nr:hypothetical protein [Magnetococcales bacterium]